MQLVDINTWLPGDILVKADRMAMAHGLELRAPFLDREVHGGGQPGWPGRRRPPRARPSSRCARRSASCCRRRPRNGAKLGFPVPIGHWFRGELYGFAEQVVREAQDRANGSTSAPRLDMLRRFRAGDPEVSWRQVWVLVVFSLWHQIYVERVYDPVALGWESRRQRRLAACGSAAVG